jgi:hypothetical protein
MLTAPLLVPAVKIPVTVPDASVVELAITSDPIVVLLSATLTVAPFIPDVPFIAAIIIVDCWFTTVQFALLEIDEF